MIMDKNTLKAVFGLIIFMFSLAFAYFTAQYVESEMIFDYWSMLIIFAGAYAIVGILVYHIFSISLGFLFAADILILHLLFENFGDISPLMKTVLVGLILGILYGFAWKYMKDEPMSSIATPSSTSTPPPPLTPPAPPTAMH